LPIAVTLALLEARSAASFENNGAVSKAAVIIA